MYFDQHIHSRFSQDGTPTIVQIAEAALKAGLSRITITDHFDLCDDEIGYRFYLGCEEERRAELERAREEYAGRLEIGWGLELGQPYFYPETARRFLNSRSFDFILGSVHYGRDKSDLYLVDYSDPGTVDRVLREYFADLLELLEFGGFDCLAHLDYPLRKMQGCIDPPSVLPWREWIEPVLARVVEKNLALEVNTRGFMDWKNRQEPEDWVLSRYRELGGRLVTVGSDAHTVQAVGKAADLAQKKLLSLGFTHVAYYRGRSPVLEKMEDEGENGSPEAGRGPEIKSEFANRTRRG